ncbi:MAG: TonB-dependent receptor [Steroidobacteraceae bacterium]|jgi:outer membrane receptor protein involved in Fe transport|nr:TonB-dependent receptor [Steroidobacteraceae bacterium]
MIERGWRALFGAASCVLAAAAAAQQPVGGGGAGSSEGLDEIVVTARKVEERLLDVPLTITAFSTADIERTGAFGLRDLANLTPGLFVSSSLGSRSSDRIAIRGISAVAGTAGFAGIFIDGVYLPSGFAQAIELSNVERIEVLKGPQSALFGRATLSGAINYVTRRPGDEWESQAIATAGEFGLREVSGNVQGPLSDTWSLMLGGRYFERGSMFVNQLTGAEELGGQSSRNGTLGLRWRPNEDFDAYFRLLVGRDSDEAAAVYHQNSLANNCLLQPNPMAPTQLFPTYFCGEVVPNANAIRTVTSNASVPAGFRGTYQDDGVAGLDRDATRASLQLDWTRGDLTFSSVTALGAEKVRDANDLTTRAAFGYAATVGLPSITFDRDVRFRDFSQELRVAYSGDGPVSGLFGLFYFDNKRTEFLAYRAGSAAADAGRRNETNYAAFGRLQWDPTDRLSIAAEGRLQRDEIGLVNRSSTPNIDLSVTTDSFLPRVTVDYKLNESLMFYGVASRGTKPATINTAPELTACPERQKTQEEQADNFEVGIKGQLFDRRLTFAAALFDIDWTSQEYAGVLQPGECGNNAALIRLTVNGGETRIRGIELETDAILIQDWLTVRATYSINDTQIKVGRATTATEALEGILGYGTSGFTPTCQFVPLVMGAPPAGSVQSPFCPTAVGGVNTLQGGDFRGLNTSFPAQAEYLASLSATLGHAIGSTGYDWYLRADLSRASKQYESIFNYAFIGPRENVNLRLGITNENLEFALWARNLTDDDTPTAVLRSISFQDDDGAGPRTANSRGYTLYLNDPRMYGATFIYRF